MIGQLLLPDFAGVLRALVSAFGPAQTQYNQVAIVFHCSGPHYALHYTAICACVFIPSTYPSETGNVQILDTNT